MNLTKKITESAVCAAIATVAVLITVYTPANFVPLIFASVAYYIALRRTGAWGLLSLVASLSLAFVFTGPRDSFIMLAVMFAPYALLCAAMQKLDYNGVKNTAVRSLIVVVFFCAVAVLSVQVAEFITEIDISAILEKFGAWMVYLMFALLGIPTDFFFVYATDRILKMLGKIDANGQKK